MWDGFLDIMIPRGRSGRTGKPAGHSTAARVVAAMDRALSAQSNVDYLIYEVPLDFQAALVIVGQLVSHVVHSRGLVPVGLGLVGPGMRSQGSGTRWRQTRTVVLGAGAARVRLLLVGQRVPVGYRPVGPVRVPEEESPLKRHLEELFLRG